MNKKGFTLIELLAVIVILAVIALIATPVIMNAISSAKEKAYYRQVEMVESAAELYIANKINNEIEVEEYIFLDSLVAAERLKGIPTDSLHGGNLKGVIKTTFNGSGYDYEYVEVNSNSGEVVYIDPTKTVSSITIEGNTIQDKSIGLNLIDVSSFVNYAGGALSPRQSYYKLETPTKIVATNQPLSAPLPGFKVFMDGKTTLVVSGKSNLTSVRVWYRCYDSSNNIVLAQTNKSSNTVNEMFQVTISNIPVTTDYVNIGVGNDQVANYWLDELKVQYTNVDDVYHSFEPNSPTFNYNAPIQSVSGSIIMGGNNYSIPTLRKINTSIDSYNLTSGLLTRNVEVKNFNGTENWNTDGNYYFVDTFGGGNNATIKYWLVNNSFYDTKSNNANTYSNRFFFTDSGAGYFEFSKYKFATVADFKAYLVQANASSNPVSVTYTLKTPFTSTISTVQPSNYNGYVYFDGPVKGNIVVSYQ